MYNLNRGKINSKNSTKAKRQEIKLYYCKNFILFVKLFNIT